MSVDFDEIRCNDHKWQNVVTIGVGTMMVCCGTYALANFICKWNQQKSAGNGRARDVQPFMVRVTIIGCICCLLAMIGILTNILACILDKTWVAHAASIHFNIFYSLNGVILLFMFDYRLYSIFKGSAYGYSNYVFVILIFLFTIWLVSLISSSLSIYLQTGGINGNSYQTMYLFGIVYAGFFIQAFITVKLFIRSLFRVCGNFFTNVFALIF